ncbi:ribosomal protein S19 binding protein 1 [Acyrthosiphon pisum]|uniref:ACYPI004655 protein n=1 Tax=Acyrthosiphon pisum TaxID=7029 RepID=C4WUA3_ACYPI|nr:ribosomal protein S19 binding protein 1 [Acyrthosiphon pisum]BAH71473.1 ACYPI004655 [Acyrthosiphon pisum]|eukprot:NP_001128378.1 ribosomal protein S19 binding protein 1 [Acyrthosiphon pisum]
MSYSTLKKALQLFEEQPLLNQKTTQKKSATKSSRLNKSKSKSQRAKSVFKVPNFMKSDAGKSVLKIKEQIKNEKELNLVQLNLERLHKLDRTSCVNNIASNLIKQRLVNLSSEIPNSKKEESTVFTDEDFEKFEREYFQD